MRVDIDGFLARIQRQVGRRIDGVFVCEWGYTVGIIWIGYSSRYMWRELNVDL